MGGKRLGGRMGNLWGSGYQKHHQLGEITNIKPLYIIITALFGWTAKSCIYLLLTTGTRTLPVFSQYIFTKTIFSQPIRCWSSS